MVSCSSILETIPKEEEEEEEEDEEENVPLQRRTWLARAMEQDKRRTSIKTPPPALEEPLEVSSSEDEVQQWVDE